MTPTIERLIEYFEQQKRLQDDPMFIGSGREAYQDAIDVCQNYAASLNRQGWTRVEDGLPEIDEKVLILYDGEVCMAFHDGENWVDPYEYFLGQITHWMPLPNKPSI